jgi:hypothetical protein
MFAFYSISTFYRDNSTRFIGLVFCMKSILWVPLDTVLQGFSHGALISELFVFEG